MGQDSLSGYDVDVTEEGERSSFFWPSFLSGSSLPRTVQQQCAIEYYLLNVCAGAIIKDFLARLEQAASS